MDEVENPDLPAAGESSPTIRPIDQEESDYTSLVDKSTADDAKSEGPVDSANPSPITQPAAPSTFTTTTRPTAPTRPTLKRETSAPPPQQPPPAPPTQFLESPDFSSDPPDSLTLADLKRIRSTFPAIQPPPKQEILTHDQVYDFQYQDAQSLPVELEEWFTYSAEEELRLRKCKIIFNQVWRNDGVGDGKDWVEVGDEVRREFVEKEVESLRVTGGRSTTSIMIMVYLALGCWEETAGREMEGVFEGLLPRGNEGGGRLEEYNACGMQIQWVVRMVKLLHSCGGLGVVYECLQSYFEKSFANSPLEQSTRNEAQPKRGEESMDLWCCLTLMYLFVEVARTTKGEESKVLKKDLLALEPKLINFLTQITAKLRWDDVAPVPLAKMLLLSWKTILVTFGGIAEVEHVKASLRKDDNGSKEDDDEKDQRGKPVITASPLDYHLFRQEISSKYPAYQPPAPAFPLEPENNSILPPLKHRQPSYSSTDSTFGGVPAVGAPSIMHQPVHIATPAPSPPPSPAGPGKAGKKQNYQTNQMFPFLYPPLDESSSELGGKGSTSLQDALVGRKWEGSDVPTSILEAAELFAKRMRATRGMKQLWEARVEYMKFERGWKDAGNEEEETNEDVEDFELLPKPKPEETAEQGAPLPASPRTEEQKKLEAVREYYEDSLPHLQSVVIVLLKAVLQSVTDMVTKNNGQNGLQAGIQFDQPGNFTNGSAKPMGESGFHNGDGIENTAEELDKLRTQEIAAKALSAILLLLLKWFKVCHVLQYEYLTQLLLDSNYVPLVLKLWQTQEIGRAVHYKLEREESNFFHFCWVNSRQGASGKANGNGASKERDAEAVADESEDEAAPPPIKRNREQQASDASSAALSDDMMAQDPAAALPGAEESPIHPPEVDELGYPITPLPPSPLKSYSWRNLFTSINYLRILQKVTRRKTHRALLLVSYKSSNHLKKTLKIPVAALRLYTLKLFKTQVPFCGRKWRQGNMKVITAVWLSVPAELRDDWLSGGGGGMGGACVGDVDGTVEDALPLEQSLRNLTHWWNVRNFADVMGVQDGIAGLEEREGGGWFERELGRMGVLGLVGEEGEEREGGLEEEMGAREGEWGGPIEGY